MTHRDAVLAMRYQKPVKTKREGRVIEGKIVGINNSSLFILDTDEGQILAKHGKLSLAR